MEERKILNKEQLKAIQYGEGPLLIIAGAGTGKTTVVTERIKWLVSEGLAKPAEILALTFTDKASREMEERVDVAMPLGFTQMWISTFHSFCDRVLRSEAFHIGLDPGYRLMTEAEAVIFLRKNLFKFDLNYFRPLGNPNKFINGMLQHFSRLKDEDVSPSEYLRWAQSQISSLKTQNQNSNLKTEQENLEKYLELAKAYQTYEELKVREGVADFGDLISNTLKLFRVRKNVLRQYQDQFKYILVDEFQDTNYSQNELAMLLAGERANLTVTGDDDQSIYRFRGAAISNIIQFRKNYPKAKIVVLVKNYRSTQEILDKAYQLIQNNNPDRLEVKEKIDKKLVGERGLKGDKIEFLYADRVENEAEMVAKEIAKLKSGNPNLKYSDFAILVRANGHVEPFIRALSRQGIPYQFLGPGMLFRQAEVKDLIAYLKVLYNFEDSVSLFRVLSMEIFDLSSRDLAAINNFCHKVNLSLFEACEQIAKPSEKYQRFLPFINQQTQEKIAKIVEMVHRHLKFIHKETAGQILYYFLEDSGLLRKLTEYKTPVEERQALNISKFFDKLKTFEVEHEDASVSSVVDWLEMSLELGESPLATDLDWTEVDSVNLLTVHSSKGLEFSVIFLVNLVSQRFPTIERREQISIPQELIKEILPVGDYHLEEERRLFYVGATRARDRLYLSAANYYGEAKRERKLSPFVYETLGEQIKIIKTPPEKNVSQLTLLDWKKEEVREEKRLIRPIEYLSYSQISSFQTCPLQYKYRYVLRIPVPASAAGAFGESVHKALYNFYLLVKQGQNPPKDKLLQLLGGNWLPLGYKSKEHEEKRRKQGEEMLSAFYDRFYDPKIIPRNLEQVFKIEISPGFRVGGKIDRADELTDGTLEIIDYKTGKVPSQKEIENDLQMTVYAMAATDEGIYKKKPEEVVLTFYFLDTQEKIESKRTKEQLKKAKEELVAKKEEIEKSNSSPRVGPWCDFCDFRMICEAWG